MPKKSNPKPAAPVETEASGEEQSGTEESEPTTPSPDESPEEEIEEEKEEPEESEEEPEEKKEKPKAQVKPSPKTDPLIIEYADSLKSQLGKDYDKELDKLPLKERIVTMKFLVKAKAKPANLTEGKVPKGKPTEKPVRVGGYNFKELGQKY